VSQVAFADRILLNKIDLVSAEQLQDVAGLRDWHLYPGKGFIENRQR